MGVSRERGGNFVSIFRALARKFRKTFANFGDFKRLKDGRPWWPSAGRGVPEGSRNGSHSIPSASCEARSKAVSVHLFILVLAHCESNRHSFCLVMAPNEFWAAGISRFEGAYFAKFRALCAPGKFRRKICETPTYPVDLGPPHDTQTESPRDNHMFLQHYKEHGPPHPRRQTEHTRSQQHLTSRAKAAQGPDACSGRRRRRLRCGRACPCPPRRPGVRPRAALRC